MSADAAQQAPERRPLISRRTAQWLLPTVIGIVVLLLWEGLVYYKIHVEEVAYFNSIFPAPSAIATAMVNDWSILWPAWLVTLWTTAQALFWAVLIGVGLAIAFNISTWVEYGFFPYAVVLQVTPVVAIAPLIITLLDDLDMAMIVCAWIVAFFPILSNTVIGLRSVDHGLLNLFEMHGANRWEVLWFLRLPSALPYFLASLRISAGLSLIGAVVGEFVAYGRTPGLATRILVAGFDLKIPRMFAALVLISFTGIVLFLLFSLLSHLLLRKWHESAVKREN